MEQSIDPSVQCSCVDTSIHVNLCLAAITAYRAVAFPDAGAPPTTTRLEVSGMGSLVPGTENVSCEAMHRGSMLHS